MPLPEGLKSVDLFQIATITLVHLEAYQKYGARFSVPILRSLSKELEEFFGHTGPDPAAEGPSCPPGVGDGAAAPERPPLEAAVSG